MQKRKIVSAMMGTAIAMVNLSSAAVPVYAKSNFIFPTVSIATKTDVKNETKEELIPVKVADTKQEEQIVLNEKNMEDTEKNVNSEEILNKQVVEPVDFEKDLLKNEIEDGLADIMNSEEAASIEEVHNIDVPQQDYAMEETIEEKESVFVESAELEDVKTENAPSEETTTFPIEFIGEETLVSDSLETKETKIELELNHNICQTQHVNVEDCYLYDYPSEEIGKKIEHLQNKTSLFIIGDTINDFYSVSYNDTIYYIKKDNVVRILKEDFKDVETTVAYLNQKSNILNFTEEQAKTLIAEDVPINTKLEITGEHELGYVKVLFEEQLGYIAKENYSETRLIPKTSEIQMKISENASNPDTSPCESGYCAAWVASIYHSVGLYRDKGLGNAIDFWTKWGTNDGITSSTRYDNIPVGAVVVGSGSGGDLGNTYGHVGIYLGDGLVAENIGKHNIVSLEKWMEKNIGVCDGYQGYIGWVFPFNIDLQDY